MTERAITFTSDGLRLTGTLTSPAGSGAVGPAAVLISGSGPIDRNSNMKRQELEVMHHMADHLASQGIASFRYDKRGVGDSEGEYRECGFWDNVADARAALEAMRREVMPATSFVVGHSEGALIATSLAADSAPLDGAVLLAGSARTGRDILEHQAVIANDALPGLARFVFKLLRTDVHKLQAKRLAKLEGTEADVVRIQGLRINAKWFREFMAHNPADDMPRIRIPLLAITGAKDLQVPPEDIETMTALVSAPIETQVPADLTHLLRLDPEPPTLKAYRRQIKQPTDQDLLETVSSWINRTDASRPDGGAR